MPPHLTLDDELLAPTPSLTHAVDLLTTYTPPNKQQSATRADMLAFIAAHPEDAHKRSCIPGHLTASALVLDSTGERALLTLHKKLGRWLQLGGHCDGDANLPAVALRECLEESGIPGLTVDPRPIDLDIHPIPARTADPEHLHLDARFLVHAPEGAREVLSHESVELAWFGPHELEGLGLDPSVLRLFQLAFGA